MYSKTPGNVILSTDILNKSPLEKLPAPWIVTTKFPAALSLTLHLGVITSELKVSDI